MNADVVKVTRFFHAKQRMSECVDKLLLSIGICTRKVYRYYSASKCRK